MATLDELPEYCDSGLCADNCAEFDDDRAVEARISACYSQIVAAAANGDRLRALDVQTEMTALIRGRSAKQVERMERALRLR